MPKNTRKPFSREPIDVDEMPDLPLRSRHQPPRLKTPPPNYGPPINPRITEHDVHDPRAL